MRPPHSLASYLSVRSLLTKFIPAIISAAILCSLIPANVEASTRTLSCWPGTLAFGTVALGESETLLITLTNNGTSSTTITSVAVSSSEFSVAQVALPLVLSAGQSIDFSVTFAPTVAGWKGGKLSFVASPSTQSINVTIGGTGVASQSLTATPASLSFGQVDIGSSATAAVVLTNNRAHSLTLSGLRTSATEFSVSGLTFPISLSPGASVSLSITFTPHAAGLDGGSVLVEGPALNIPFSGTGVTAAAGQLTISPATLSFGSVLLGESETLPAELTATGGSVTISSASSSSALFALPGTSFPITLSAGQSVSLNVVFTPQSSGTDSGTLSFSSNATNSSATESLTGTGAAPYVSLYWSPSTSQVAGYNIYRCLQSNCTYARINPSLESSTAFTDNGVAIHTNYYYVTTAVSSSGEESGYSNQVGVSVP